MLMSDTETAGGRMNYCKWWGKTLVYVEEDAQEVCLHEGHVCTSCPYLVAIGVDPEEGEDNA